MKYQQRAKTAGVLARRQCVFVFSDSLEKQSLERGTARRKMQTEQVPLPFCVKRGFSFSHET